MVKVYRADTSPTDSVAIAWRERPLAPCTPVDMARHDRMQRELHESEAGFLSALRGIALETNDSNARRRGWNKGRNLASMLARHGLNVRETSI
jgi:hypothetical protein